MLSQGKTTAPRRHGQSIRSCGLPAFDRAGPRPWAAVAALEMALIPSLRRRKGHPSRRHHRHSVRRYARPSSADDDPSRLLTRPHGRILAVRTWHWRSDDLEHKRHHPPNARRHSRLAALRAKGRRTCCGYPQQSLPRRGRGKQAVQPWQAA
jgi:hypothetical protein